MKQYQDYVQNCQVNTLKTTEVQKLVVGGILVRLVIVTITQYYIDVFNSLITIIIFVVMQQMRLTVVHTYTQLVCVQCLYRLVKVLGIYIYT